MDLTGVPSAEKISQWLERNGWSRVSPHGFGFVLSSGSYYEGLSIVRCEVPPGDGQVKVAQRVLALAIIAEAQDWRGLTVAELAELIAQADLTVEQKLTLPEKKPLPRDGSRLDKMDGW